MQGKHQGKSLSLVAGVAAASLLQAGSHPPFSLGLLALLVAAPVAAVLLDAEARPGWRRAAAAGFAFGTLSTWLMTAAWSWQAARVFFSGQPLEAAAFAAALPLIASGIAFHYALAFVLIARLAGLGAVGGVLGSAAIWAAAEMARTALGYGNPWGAFAAALATVDVSLSGFRAETPVGGLLALGGPALVAFVASAVGSALGLAWKRRRDVEERGRALLTGAAVFALAMLASRTALSSLPPRLATSPAQPLRVALVQAGLGRNHLWEGEGAAESFQRHVEMTRGYETLGADLIVWPENSLPFLLDANPDKRQALRALAKERGAALLAGGSRSEAGSDGKTRVFNSAFLFPADGSEALVYDKRILLPFLEHVPDWAAPFLESPWQGAFREGDGQGVFHVKDWRIAPLLCLEAVYPGEAVSRVEEGADLLVNLSNDSWFDEGAGPEQHFSLAGLLSAQTRRPLVRVATTGVSAVVGEDGLLSWRLPVRTAAVALIDVAPPRQDSFYVRGGRVGFAAAILAIAAAAIFLSSRLTPTGGGNREPGAPRAPGQGER